MIRAREQSKTKNTTTGSYCYCVFTHAPKHFSANLPNFHRENYWTSWPRQRRQQGSYKALTEYKKKVWEKNARVIRDIVIDDGRTNAKILISPPSMSKGTFTLVKQMKLFTHQTNVFPHQWDSNADFSTCGFPTPGDHCPPSWNPTEKWQRNVKIQSVPQCIIWAARYQVQFVHFSNFRHDNFNNVTEVSFNIYAR